MRAVAGRLALLALAGLLGCAPGPGPQPPAVPHPDRRWAGTHLTYYGDALEAGVQVEQLLADRFEADTGVQVDVIPMSPDATQSFQMARRMLGANRHDVDVINLDVIWIPSLGPFLAPVPAALGAEQEGHLPRMLAMARFGEGLVALPKFLDVGALFYRTDLARKYGFDAPPATWDELERQARTVQAGERRANPPFWGFVWQGKAYEGLTCNALEWQTSEGVPLASADGRSLRVDAPLAVAAFTRASRWLGTISPSWTTDLMESESRMIFQEGNAAFMRNWSSHYAMLAERRSPVRGRFGVAPVPHGRGESASALGGAFIGVAKTSGHPAAAFAFARYMTCAEVQAWRAQVASYLPTRGALFETSRPPGIVSAFRPLLADMVARPAAVAGDRYPEASEIYFRGVSQVLQGKAAPPIIRATQRELDDLLRRRPAAAPALSVPAQVQTVPHPLPAPAGPP
jgi:trehalose/maltose transport system substrate-binding protein